MPVRPLNKVNSLKLSVLFSATAVLSACSSAVDPVMSDSQSVVAPQQTGSQSEPQLRYDVVMIRKGCEVGRVVYEDGTPASTMTAICPSAGSSPAADKISKDVSYHALYNRFGCEVGVLTTSGYYRRSFQLTLCPAQGESTTSHMVTVGKIPQLVVNEQRRPG